VSRFDHIFNRLNLEEKARAFDHAKSRGYIITTIAEEAVFAPVVPIEVIPADEIPRSHFAQLNDETFESLKGYYRVTDAKDTEIYPPLGYTPSVRQEEKEAASFLRYMLTVADKDGIERAIENGYPLAKLELPAKTRGNTGRRAGDSKRQGLKSRLTSLFS